MPAHLPLNCTFAGVHVAAAVFVNIIINNAVAGGGAVTLLVIVRSYCSSPLQYPVSSRARAVTPQPSTPNSLHTGPPASAHIDTSGVEHIIDI